MRVSLRPSLLLLAVLALGTIGGLATISSAPQPVPTRQFRPAFPSSAELQSGLTAAVGVGPAERQVVGAIVNHHLLAADFIGETLGQARRQVVRRVILLSPNHFAAGRGWVISADTDWETPFGTLRGDHQFIQRLAAERAVALDTDAVGSDHGVYNILPFIRRLFPQATVVPIIFKQGVPASRQQRLVQSLRQIDRQTLVIASLDFTHGAPASVAQENDAVSVGTIDHLDGAGAERLAIDSPQALHVLLDVMRESGATFRLAHRGDSGDRTGDTTSVTSYVTGVFLAGRLPWHFSYRTGTVEAGK